MRTAVEEIQEMDADYGSVCLRGDRRKTVCFAPGVWSAVRPRPLFPFLQPSVVLLLFVFVVSVPSAVFGESLELDFVRSLAAVHTVCGEALEELDAGRKIDADLTRLATLSESLVVDHLLLSGRHETRTARVGRLGGTAQSRENEVSSRYHEAMTELLSLLDTLMSRAEDPRPLLEKIVTILDEMLAEQSHPIFGTLPYRHADFPALLPLRTPETVPAYRGGDRGTVMPADTAETKEAPISRPIAELAQELSWNPVQIYEWVMNEVATEWYWGAMKGAEETLRQRSGNDADQASLLIALLRASGYPARYVRGVIEFFPDIASARMATGLDDPLKIAAFFQRAGIPVEPVIEGGTITNLRVEHVWVETEVPYANYRGAVLDEHGKLWTPLDTSIKASGYTDSEGLEPPGDYPLSWLRDGYLSTSRTESFLSFLRGDIETFLATANPDTTYADLLQSRIQNPFRMDILPGSLQFTEVAVFGKSLDTLRRGYDQACRLHRERLGKRVLDRYAVYFHVRRRAL